MWLPYVFYPCFHISMHCRHNYRLDVWEKLHSTVSGIKKNVFDKQLKGNTCWLHMNHFIFCLNFEYIKQHLKKCFDFKGTVLHVKSTRCANCLVQHDATWERNQKEDTKRLHNVNARTKSLFIPVCQRERFPLMHVWFFFSICRGSVLPRELSKWKSTSCSLAFYKQLIKKVISICTNI